MTAGMNLTNLYQNEYSFEEKVNENFKKVDSFSTLSVKTKITSSKAEIENDVLYLIDNNNDDFLYDKIGQIACYNANIGWFFYQPKEGSIAFLQDEKKFYFYSENTWQELQNGTIQTTDGTNIDLSLYLKKTSNFSDLNDILTARNNLNVYSKDEVYSKGEIDEKIVNSQTIGEVDTSAFLKTNNNLNDITNKEIARTNLNVYSKEDVYSKDETYSKSEIENKISNISISGDGTSVDTKNCLLKDNNLSDLSNVAIARDNLDVYAKSDTYNRSKNLLDILDKDTACHNIGTLRDWEIRRVGDYKFSAMKTDHDNWLICDGREIGRAEYPKLFTLIGTSFGVGDGSATFNLPDFRDKTLWGANGNLNNALSSGLPNITGAITPGSVSGLTYAVGVGSVDGCFANSAKVNTNFLNNTSAKTATAVQIAKFDASASNSIYGNSTIVQPPAICVNVFILAK